MTFGALLFTISQAVKARNLSMEFAESAQIFRALVVINMALFVGGPVLLLSRDNVNTFVFVASAIIFVASASILVLLFVPKIRFWMNSKKTIDKRRLFISGMEMSGRMNTSQFSLTVDTCSDVDVDYSEQFTGMKILTTKTPDELVREVELLKRLLRRTTTYNEKNSHSKIDALNEAEGKGQPSWNSLGIPSSPLSSTIIEGAGMKKSDVIRGLFTSEHSEEGMSLSIIPDDDSTGSTIENKEYFG